MSLFVARICFYLVCFGLAIITAVSLVPPPTAAPLPPPPAAVAPSDPASAPADFPDCFHEFEPTQWALPANHDPGIQRVMRMARLNGTTPVDRQAALHAMPAVPLCEAISHPGEAPQDFMMRVAQPLRAFAEWTSLEACGYLTHDPTTDTFGIRLTTNGGHAFCVNSIQHAYLEPGFRLTTTTLHNHPTADRYAPTLADQTVFTLLKGPHAGPLPALQRNFGMLGFSPQDIQAGPGYLVAGGLLWFQRGKGTERIVGEIAE